MQAPLTCKSACGPNAASGVNCIQKSYERILINSSTRCFYLLSVSLSTQSLNWCLQL